MRGANDKLNLFYIDVIHSLSVLTDNLIVGRI